MCRVEEATSGAVVSCLALAWACVSVSASAPGGVPVVPIPEFRRWEQNMVRYGKKHFDERNKGFTETAVWYYDGARVFFQIADYTKDPKWNEAAQNCEAVYRRYVFETKGRCHGWRIFPHGLAMDWRRNGDGKSKEAALLLATKSVFARLGGGEREGYSRETAYIINAYLVAEALGEPRSRNLKKAVDYALGHIDQWFVQDSSGNWAPFMFGLTCEALISCHEKVEPDPRILPAIKLGLDECWKRAWREKERAFFYRANNPARGAADLNLLIAPAFAWVYLQTRDPKYRDRGDKAFAGGVRGAWLDGGKIFSQNYRWSFDYIRWRREAELGPARTAAEPKKKERGMLLTVKRTEKPDPLAAFEEGLSPVRERAAAADFKGALEMCDEVLASAGEEDAVAALERYRAGLEAGAELKRLIIAGAAGRLPMVYVDFAGRPARMRLLSADEEGGRFEMRGMAVSMEWRQIPPVRFRGIAARFAPEGDAGRVMLERYCAAMGLAADASRDAGLRGEAEPSGGLPPPASDRD